MSWAQLLTPVTSPVSSVVYVPLLKSSRTSAFPKGSRTTPRRPTALGISAHFHGFLAQPDVRLRSPYRAPHDLVRRPTPSPDGLYGITCWSSRAFAHHSSPAMRRGTERSCSRLRAGLGSSRPIGTCRSRTVPFGRRAALICARCMRQSLPLRAAPLETNLGSEVKRAVGPTRCASSRTRLHQARFQAAAPRIRDGTSAQGADRCAP